MRAALALACRGLGRVAPNPAVGCILVRESLIVGRGWTQPGGRPHAETEALRRAGAAARGATAYVGLEPCAHQGVTGPCSEALVEAGVSRVVVALEDPDPRVAGRGLACLRQAGVEVVVGVCADEAAEVNEGFLLRVRQQRPMFTLKLATSLDGRIATHGGDSRWITGDAARRAGHRLRATHDAILVGSATALADDPDLTCRLPGMDAWSPVRVVLDGRLRLPVTSRLAQTTQQTPVWVLTTSNADAECVRALSEAGVDIIPVDGGSGGSPDPRAVATLLAARGMTRVLIEGGGKVAAAFLAAGLIDRLAWFHAPRIIGGEGRPAVADLSVDRIASAPSFVLHQARLLARDLLSSHARETATNGCSPAS